MSKAHALKYTGLDKIALVYKNEDCPTIFLKNEFLSEECGEDPEVIDPSCTIEVG